MLQGDAASRLLPFSNAGKTKTDPKFPNWGLQASCLDVLGLAGLPRGHSCGAECGRCHLQGSAGCQRYTTVPKGDPERAAVTLWRFSVFSPKKETGDGTAVPQGHLWSDQEGHCCPVLLPEVPRP